MPTQVERLTRVEEKVDNLTKTVQDFINSADKKYASKLSERIVYALCGIVLATVVGVVMSPLKSPQQTVTITSQNPDGTTTTRVVPLSGDGQNITISPSSSQPSSQPTESSPSDPSSPSSSSSPPAGQPAICQVPLIGGLCK